MREISIDLSHRQSNPTVFAGYEGEHNATQVTVILPIEMANSKEITTFYPRFCTSCREDYVGETIVNAGDQKIIFKAHQAITRRGKTEIQIEGKDSKGNIIARSALGYLVFNPSVNNQGKELGLVVNDAEELTRVKEELQELIDEASELLDNTDLSNYYTKTETDQALTKKANKSELPQKVSELENDSGYLVAADIENKADKPQKEYFPDVQTITLADNTNYVASDVISNLTIIYPEGDFIASLTFTLASEGDITITLPESKYIGGAPTFANGETWELNIKNGVVVGGLVE